MLFNGYVAAVPREIERSIRLAVFTVAVGQLGNKVSLIAPFCPCLSKTHADGSGRPSYLVGQSVFFFSRESLAELKDGHREIVSLAINIEFFRGSNEHRKSSPL